VRERDVRFAVASESDGVDARLEELTRRAERERLLLAESLGSVASDVRRHRMAWKFATATGLAAAATGAWKLFGRNSAAAKIGKAASGASILLGLGRAFLRLRRFL
jgi:predicted transcriptional regulator